MWRILLLVISLLSVSSVWSQTGRQKIISIEFNDESLIRAIKKTRNKSGFRLAYTSSDLKPYRVSGRFENKSIQVILGIILPESLNFSIIDDLIIIYKTQKINPANKNPRDFNFRLTGKVKDFFSNEALPYATLEVVSSGFISQSNQEGEFQIEKFPSDTSSLRISYVGYRDKIIRPSQLNGFPSIHVGLKPETTIIDGAVIESYESTPILSKKEISSFSVNVLQIPQVTNLGETDALALVKELPGFDSSTENNLGLGTRGLRADENLYYLDGFTVFNPDHFFGLFSSLNSLSVKNIRVLKGAYDASYGGRGSSVFDITSYDGSELRLGGKIKTGLLSSSFRLDGPLVRNKLKFSITGRKSHVSVLNTKLYRSLFNSIYNSNVSFAGSEGQLDAFSTDIDPVVDFTDVQGKLSYSLNDRNSLAFSGFYSQDFSKQFISDTLVNGAFISNYNNAYEWFNYGGSVIFKSIVSGRLSSKQQVSYSNFSSANNTLQTVVDDLSLTPNQELQSSFSGLVTELTIKSKWDYIYSDSLRLAAGAELSTNQVDSKESSFSISTFEEYQQKSFLNYFGQVNVNRVRWRLQLGLRAINDLTDEDFFVEPRVHFSYNLNSNIALKGGFGRHHQFLRKTQSLNFFRGSVDQWRLAGDATIPVSKVNHSILGINIKKGKAQFDTEFFRLEQKGAFENLTELLSQANQNKPNVVFGDLLTFGVELTGQLNVKRNNFSLSYALYDSAGDYMIDGRKQRIANSRVSDHNLSGLWLWESNRLRFSLGSSFTSGKPYTPIVGNYILELPNGESRPFLIFGQYNSADLEHYFRTDITLGYRKEILNSIGLEISGSIQNIFDIRNTRYFSYSVRNVDNSEKFLIFNREVSHLQRLASLFVTLKF